MSPVVRKTKHFLHVARKLNLVFPRRAIFCQQLPCVSLYQCQVFYRVRGCLMSILQITSKKKKKDLRWFARN